MESNEVLTKAPGSEIQRIMDECGVSFAYLSFAALLLLCFPFVLQILA